MKYAQIRKYDVANGPGIRLTLFVSGCSRNCKGCFNKNYQDFNYGVPWTKQSEDDFVKMAKDDNIHGITILGGEPAEQDTALFILLKRLKEEVGKSIWVFTGYTFEYIQERMQYKNPCFIGALDYIDVLVDGPFIEEKKDITLKFRGSSNQRILDVKKSIEQGEAVEYVL